MKYNIRKYILAGITAILAAAVLTACGGSKPEKDDTVQSTQEIFAMDRKLKCISEFDGLK